MTNGHLHLAEDVAESPGESMADAALITHDIAAEAFLDAFRRRVGMGAGKVSVADLADALDVQARTVKAWRDGETMPHWCHMLRVLAYFGPAFTCEVLEPAGLGGVERIAVPTAQADPEGIAADLIAAGHDLLQRLRAGRFDHRDSAETAPRLLELSRKLEAQARALGRKPG